jgi:hypothetical protein
MDKLEKFKNDWNKGISPDGMLNVAGIFNINKRILTLAKGHCANTVRHLMMDDRSIKAVDTAIAFGEGRATESELNIAYYHVYNINSSIYNENIIYAHLAATTACNNNMNTAYFTYKSSTDKKENEKLTADICRKYLTELVFNSLDKNKIDYLHYYL